VKADTESKLKFKQLQRRLGLALWQCRGLLDTLWKFARDNAPDGNIGRYSAEEIAVGIDWQESPSDLVNVLVATKWADRVDGKLLIHDWPDHCEDSVHRQLARARLYFANGDEPKFTRLDARERPGIEAWYAARRRPDAQPSADQASACVPGTHAVSTPDARPCSTPGVPGTHDSEQESTVVLTQDAQSEVRSSRPCVPTVTEPLPLPSQAIPDRTEPSRASAPSPSQGRAGPLRASPAEKPGSHGSDRSGSAGKKFLIPEADGPEILDECLRIRKVVKLGAGGKLREDRELIFKVVALKQLGEIPEQFVAEAIAAVEREKPEVATAYFKSCLIKRLDAQKRSLHTLLEQVPIPDWAEMTMETGRLPESMRDHVANTALAGAST
jgi:hypothetical protein